MNLALITLKRTTLGILAATLCIAAPAQTLYVPGGTGGIGSTLAGNGNVGIGTSSPQDKLHVQGSGIAIDNPSAEGGRLRILNTAKTGAITNDWSIWNMTSSYGNGLSFWRYYADGTNAGPAVWFGDNGNVGIGTTTPSRKLSVQGDLLLSDGQRGSLIAHDLYSGSRAFLALDIDSTDGVASGGDYLYLAQESDQGVLTSAFGTPLRLGSWTTHVTILPSGNVGIGTTTPSHKLAVNGAIRAKEVIVDTGWSDYVFADNYRLAPLSEVEAHIKASKHLPGIPSAAEVEQGGVSLGDMQAKLLAKVEELTLHVIQQEKENTAQSSRLAALEQENAALRQQLSVLNSHP